MSFALLNTPKRFHGGIGFRSFAASALNTPTKILNAGAQSVYPLNQHQGEPAEPCVAIGDEIQAGQRIATATADPHSAHLFASCSGTVTAIKPWLTRFGVESMAMVVSNTPNEQPLGLPALTEHTLATLQQRIHDAGIVGLGGARFPTARKVALAQKHDITHLIINGIECEPYITCDQGLVSESPDTIVEGMMWLQRATGAKHMVLALREDMTHAIAALQAALEKTANNAIQLVALPNQYPQGSERQLIEALSGVRLQAGQRPHELGVMVSNVATAAAVRNAVVDNHPMTRRRITICGDAVPTSCNVDVPLGMLVGDVLHALGISQPETLDVIIGGPLSGYMAPNLNTPITKGTQALLVNSKTDSTATQAQPCIRCGECVEVCPEYLNPALLWQAQKQGDTAELQQQQLTACIECGCCDWVCPSSLPLTHHFRQAKQASQAQQRQIKKAAHFRSLHEQRNERMAAETAKPPALAVINRGQSAKDVIANLLDEESSS